MIHMNKANNSLSCITLKREDLRLSENIKK